MFFLHANSYYFKTMPSQHQDYITKFSGLIEFGLPVMEQSDHQGLRDIFVVWYVRQTVLLMHNIGMKEEDLTISRQYLAKMLINKAVICLFTWKMPSMCICQTNVKFRK